MHHCVSASSDLRTFAPSPDKGDIHRRQVPPGLGQEREGVTKPPHRRETETANSNDEQATLSSLQIIGLLFNSAPLPTLLLHQSFRHLCHILSPAPPAAAVRIPSRLTGAIIVLRLPPASTGECSRPDLQHSLSSTIPIPLRSSAARSVIADHLHAIANQPRPRQISSRQLPLGSSAWSPTSPIQGSSHRSTPRKGSLLLSFAIETLGSIIRPTKSKMLQDLWETRALQ